MFRFFILLLMAASLSAQANQYESWPAKDPEVRKLGIETLSISEEGVRGEAGYVATAEVFGPEGKFLSTCELEWHKEKVVTCSFEDGEIFRVSASGSAGAVFEDVRTGERVTAQVIGLNSEAPHSSFEGDKTEEEVMRDWGPKLELISGATSEAITRLFGSDGLLYSFPEDALLPSWAGSARCPDANEEFCVSLPLVASATSLAGANTCCSGITAPLDVLCGFFPTGFSCHHQSECNSYCLPFSFVCTCNRTFS